MCAGSEGKIKDKEVDIYMGYYGGSLSVGDDHFSVNGGNKTEEEMIEILSKYDSADLARLMVELVRDSNE